MLEKIVFYLLWPLVWFYAPLRLRVSMIVRYDGTVLVVKSNFGPGLWHFPGGGVKSGEDILTAGIREVHEELGIDVNIADCRRLHDSFMVTKQRGIMQREAFVLCKLPAKPEIRQNHEISAHMWQSIEEAPIPQKLKALVSS